MLIFYHFSGFGGKKCCIYVQTNVFIHIVKYQYYIWSYDKIIAVFIISKKSKLLIFYHFTFLYLVCIVRPFLEIFGYGFLRCKIYVISEDLDQVYFFWLRYLPKKFKALSGLSKCPQSCLICLNMFFTIWLFLNKKWHLL